MKGGMLGWGGRWGVGVMRANCWNPFYCFAIVVFPSFFFFPSAEKFTSTHETLIVGSKYIVVFHFRLPPDDFKVKARIHHGALPYNLALRTLPPGQAGDASLAGGPGQTDQNL